MPYIAPSQIAERQLDYFHGKHVLVAGEAEDRFPLDLVKHCESVTLFTTNYSYYRQFKNHASIKCIFDVQLDGHIQPTQKDKPNMVLLYWPKAKAEAEYLLAMIFAHLGEETEIVVVGENRSGVKSVEKMFTPYGPINKYDSARRCSFYWGKCTNQAKPFKLADWFKSYSLDIDGTTVIVKSLPGVFSHGQLDVGTQLLLSSIKPLSGKVLDFGCGAGVIGATLALKYPEIELDMCDISAFAIESSRETLKVNGLIGNVFASDVYSDTQSDYQFIVSNPPFHAGLDTSYSATETLLALAPRQLTKDGEIYIVANSFLKYPPIIEQAFTNYSTINKTTKFAVYHAEKR